jgi:hypothetical protein
MKRSKPRKVARGNQDNQTPDQEESWLSKNVLALFSLALTLSLGIYQFSTTPTANVEKRIEFNNTFTDLLKDVDYEYRSNLPEYLFRINRDSIYKNNEVNKSYLFSDLFLINHSKEVLKDPEIIVFVYNKVTDHIDTSYNNLHTYEIPYSRYGLLKYLHQREIKPGDSMRLDLWQAIVDKIRLNLDSIFPGGRCIPELGLAASDKLTNQDDQPFSYKSLPKGLRDKKEFIPPRVSADQLSEFPWTSGLRFKFVIKLYN